MTVVSIVIFTIMAAAPPQPDATARLLEGLAARLSQDPSNLRVAAQYRQAVIDTGRYDRSIRLFERLAKDPRGGANRFLNLALANVDRVPVSGSWREGLGVEPRLDGFRVRLDARDDQIPDIIERALDAGVRVDTTLQELFPDLTRTASKAVP